MEGDNDSLWIFMLHGGNPSGIYFTYVIEHTVLRSIVFVIISPSWPLSDK